MDLLEELKAILNGFECANVDYALCGGLAMAVYAFPRATLDIDLLIESENLGKIKSIAEELGFSIDAGMMHFRNGSIQISRLIKIEKGSEESLALDLLAVTDEIRDIWESRIMVRWDLGMISVVSPEGLIKLKSLRKSGQDEDDIAYLRSILDED